MTDGHAGRLHGTGAAYARRLGIVLAIMVSLLLAEVVGALVSGSLALLADAGHTLADAAGVGLSLVAIWFARRPATTARTFGYFRLEMLAAAVNAVVLFGLGAFIIVESVRRLVSPETVDGRVMLVFAAIALAGNGCSLLLLSDAQRHSLNARAAFLEALGDLLGAGAVVVAALVVLATGLTRADSIASLLIGGFILTRTWRLLREAVDVLLEATPRGVDLDDVRRHILEAPGVAGVHDLHAWTITSGLNVLSAHVVVAAGAPPPAVLDELASCLAGHFDIEHSTFQLETPDHRGHEGVTHP